MTLKVKNCCFCVGLRNGCLIIGYIHLLINILLTLLMIVNAEAVCRALGVAVSSNDDFFPYFVSLVAVTIFVNVVFSTAFIVGVHKNKSKLVRGYLCFILMSVAASLYLFVSEIINTGKMENGLIFCLNLLAQLYCSLVIRSFYLEMIQSERGGPSYQAT